MPPGVSTSTEVSRSVSNASGEQKLLTWRVARPLPLISTGTCSAGPYRGGSRCPARAPGSAKRPPAALRTVTAASMGR